LEKKDKFKNKSDLELKDNGEVILMNKCKLRQMMVLKSDMCRGNKSYLGSLAWKV